MEFFVGTKLGRVRLVVMSDDDRVSQDISSISGGDIYDEDLGSICDCLDKIIKLRVKPFDSSDLIENLFDKLPEKQASDLSAILYARHFQTKIKKNEDS